MRVLPVVRADIVICEWMNTAGYCESFYVVKQIIRVLALDKRIGIRRPACRECDVPSAGNQFVDQERIRPVCEFVGISKSSFRYLGRVSGL